MEISLACLSPNHNFYHLERGGGGGGRVKGAWCIICMCTFVCVGGVGGCMCVGVIGE